MKSVRMLKWNLRNSVTSLVVFYGVLCGASVGFGYNTALTIVPFWFP